MVQVSSSVAYTLGHNEDRYGLQRSTRYPSRGSRSLTNDSFFFLLLFYRNGKETVTKQLLQSIDDACGSKQ